MFRCDICSRSFKTVGAVKQHIEAKYHTLPEVYCTPCGRTFGSPMSLEQHVLSSKKHREACQLLDGASTTDTARPERGTQIAGPYCELCDRYFAFEFALQQHLNESPRHVHEFRCVTCDRGFANGLALSVHDCARPRETPAAVVKARKHCTQCNKRFKSQAACQQHLTSMVHQPICEDIQCPSCEKTFSAFSSAVQHLESGQCTGGPTKAMVDAAIMAADPNGVLVGAPPSGHVEVEEEEGEQEEERYSEGWSPDDILCSKGGSHWDYDSDNESGVKIHTPTSSRSSSSFALTIPGRLNCPLCPDRPPFVNACALQQHMESTAVHEPFIYHCPTALGGGSPEKRFRAASALIQHLEAEACRGGWKTWMAVIEMLNKDLKEKLGVQEVRPLKRNDG